jgi:nitroreductase
VKEMNVIFTRRSIRRYSDKKVENEKIEKMLKAAMQAPSAGNQQPWEFIVVQDSGMLDKLSKFSPYASMTRHASVAIVFLANTENLNYPENWEQDMGAATQNLLLEAAEMGLGAVWLGVAPVQDRVKNIKNLFDLPEHIRPYSVVPVGYPAEGVENKFVDRFNESRIHYETY